MPVFLIGETAAGPTTAPPAAAGDIDDAWAALRDQALAEEAAALGVEVPADVEFVRYLHIDEYAPVIAECVREQGFDATATSDGGVAFGQVPQDQGTALHTALIQCKAMYPVHLTIPVGPAAGRARARAGLSLAEAIGAPGGPYGVGFRAS